MTDIAQLGLAISSDGVETANTRLETFADVSKRAELAAKSTSAANDSAAKSYKNLTAAVSAASSANSRATTLTSQVINQTLNVKTDFSSSARTADIEAYGAALDNLRAKFSPIYAAEQQFKSTMNEINLAAKVGAINEAERTAAITRTQSAFDQQAQAMRNANQAWSANSGINTYGQELDRLRAKYNPLF
ncbi:MAG: hypothetical protein ABL893_21250, partial [Hyphomicrobium sp.]